MYNTTNIYNNIQTNEHTIYKPSQQWMKFKMLMPHTLQ